jgi:phage-related protein
VGSQPYNANAKREWNQPRISKAPFRAKFSCATYIKYYIIQFMKPVRFHGTSRSDLQKFPQDARREAGLQLNRVQNGLEPSDWKPMLNIGPGVREIRIKEESGQYRVLYVAKFADVVHVLHAFQKKTQRTAKMDIELAKKRYKEIGRTP